MNKNQVVLPNETISCLNYCNGDWVKPKGPEFKIISPYSGHVIGEGYESSAQDLNAVVKSAAKAQNEWGRTPLKERAQILFNLRAILKRDVQPFSHRIASESGKTFGEAEAEILKGIEVTEFALSLQNLDLGGRLEVSRGVFCEYRREPLGVVAGVTPFNFPLMVPMWMIPITIALGNSFILKPSDKTPLTSLLLAEAFREAGLPAGVFSLVQGGRSTAEAILDHPDIQAVGFVGSTAVAQDIYRRGSKNLKRVLALGGAKNHIFLMPDADPTLTAKGVADSFTGCAGQRCMAASVLCAIAKNDTEKKSIDMLIKSICEQAKAITVGDKMGAIISSDSLKRLEGAVLQAEKDGAKIILDGRRPAAPNNLRGGYWMAPTVLDNVRPGSEAAVEELFGPVLSIVRCDSLREALDIQTKSKYGNAVSVFTQNGGVADEVSRYGKAGMVGVNIGVPVPREPFSFGGVFDSKYGHGDITGAHSLDFWSNIKKITTKWAAQKDWSWMG